MGPVRKMTEAMPLSDRPVVYDYAARDVPRTARLNDMPFELPTPFSVRSVTPCRAFYWLADRDPVQARGVFGAPYIILDGEPLWGNDRLIEVDWWLETGGW